MFTWGDMMNEFKIVSEFSPTGDQPEAIKKLSEGIRNGDRCQTLLGVTGSGKTFTMASIVQEIQKPTLVVAHNKTLAAQLYSEFKEFFPNNAVEYFVSYYDYFQPEAYVAHTDTYIEKDASVNEELDRLRHSTTTSLLSRNDVIVVASVSCIYGLGDPNEYKGQTLLIKKGMELERNKILLRLVEMQYERNDINFVRGTFRVRGDVVEIIPAQLYQRAYRIELFGDEIDRICEIDVLTGEIFGEVNQVLIFPASHYAASTEKVENVIKQIEGDLEIRHKYLIENEKLLEAQRIMQRTNYDIEMLREVGYCSGIENYSRYFDGRKPGEPPYTLIDFFPEDFLMFIDESHVSLPQFRGMYAGDRSRKNTLIEYGFRLPAAFDNRPLQFNEFEKKINQVVFVSATPGPYELEHSTQIAEQIIRPTGLIDPEIIIRPVKGQIDNLIGEIRRTVKNGFRVLITTLTKKMSEDLTDYLKEANIKVSYLHSDIVTIERSKIIKELRLGVFDVLVGINLLREGLDIPEVALVAILDADKEGFLRSETSLIQTIGRAARNSESKVIMYADKLTDSMKRAIEETNRRRGIQVEYNEKNGITPTTIIKAIHEIIQNNKVSEDREKYVENIVDIEETIRLLEEQMRDAAANLQFEMAAEIRDRIMDLKEKLK
ncbi:MAG: uvrB [Clostridiales bacterium]|jgi:excinuclease ABC subunit B|nr:uvrB [Clostridiales bacterium]